MRLIICKPCIQCVVSGERPKHLSTLPNDHKETYATAVLFTVMLLLYWTFVAICRLTNWPQETLALSFTKMTSQLGNTIEKHICLHSTYPLLDELQSPLILGHLEQLHSTSLIRCKTTHLTDHVTNKLAVLGQALQDKGSVLFGNDSD